MFGLWLTYFGAWCAEVKDVSLGGMGANISLPPMVLNGRVCAPPPPLGQSRASAATAEVILWGGEGENILPPSFRNGENKPPAPPPPAFAAIGLTTSSCAWPRGSKAHTASLKSHCWQSMTRQPWKVIMRCSWVVISRKAVNQWPSTWVNFSCWRSSPTPSGSQHRRWGSWVVKAQFVNGLETELKKELMLNAQETESLADLARRPRRI